MRFDSFVIFGGSGFIGTHTANLLRARLPDAKIYIADLLAEGSEFVQRVDVRKPIDMLGEFGKNTLIFKFAAVHRTPEHPDRAYFETNIRRAENVCNFARKYGIENIVFTSSIAPYGAAEDLKSEDTLPTPNTPYGISKLVAEKIHREWAAESADRKLSIVRPGIVFGTGEHGNMTRLYKGLKIHKFAYACRKDTIKACIYVKDLARVMLAMAENEQADRIQLHNCCYYPSFTIEQIANTMLKATGMKRHIPYIPKKPMMAAATVCGWLGGLGLGICPARVKKLMVSTNIDGAKLAQDYPLQFSLEDAFKDWYKGCGGGRGWSNVADRIKIMFIAQAYPGGVPIYIETLAKHLDPSKFENILVCSFAYDENRFAPYFSAIEKVGMEQSISISKILKPAWESRKLIKKYKPDVVYCNSSIAGAVGRLAAIGCGAKVLYNAHSWAFNMRISNKKKLFYRLIERFFAYFTDTIICVSNYEKKICIAKSYLQTG